MKRRGRSKSTGIGLALGISMGVGIGVAMDNVGAGIAIGVAIGAALGSSGAFESKKGRPEESDDSGGLPDQGEAGVPGDSVKPEDIGHRAGEDAAGEAPR